jgi:hypothetical protein
MHFGSDLRAASGHIGRHRDNETHRANTGAAIGQS